MGNEVGKNSFIVFKGNIAADAITDSLLLGGKEWNGVKPKELLKQSDENL